MPCAIWQRKPHTGEVTEQNFHEDGSVYTMGPEIRRPCRLDGRVETYDRAAAEGHAGGLERPVPNKERPGAHLVAGELGSLVDGDEPAALAEPAARPGATGD